MTRPLPALVRCAACSAPTVEGAQRCTACGSPLGPAARRVVTILFADLAGYTRYCSEHDPEDVHLLVRPLMNALRSTCGELGGRVPAIEGDGFMAVFGVEETRADDPLRAVLAAARMHELVRARREVSPELPSLRVGMHVGEVLVAPSWEAGGTSVSGDAVNLASRICKEADEGELLASAGLVACAPLTLWGPVRQVHVRGLDLTQPVQALRWQALETPGMTLRGESRTPFVTRPELATARDALAAREPLLVVGEPGMGKSRLVAEAASEPGALVLRGFFSSLEEGAAGLRPLALQVLQEPGAVPLSSRRLRRLAGLEVDSDEQDAYVDQLASLVDELVRLAARRPVVLVLEDVDTASGDEAVLVANLAHVARAHFGLLMTARRPVPLRGAELRLGPLDRDALGVLVERLLPGAPAVLARHLVDRSGGVPFFVEQYARLLVEEGTVELGPQGTTLVHPDRLGSLPTAIRLFVASRLDVLDPGARRVVALAAVVGPVVDLDLLSYLAGRGEALGDDVEQLVERGYLEWHAHEPDRRRRVHFRHQVLRDVAYEGMLKSDRAATHRAAAEWYAVLPVVQLLAEEARHLEAALELGEPDCRLVRRLVEVLSQHAASLVEEHPTAALQAVDRAEAVSSANPECAADLLAARVTKARALLARGDEAAASSLASEVVGECVERELAELEAVARLTSGRCLLILAPDSADVELDRAKALFGAADDASGLARVETARAERPSSPLAGRLAAWERAYRAAMRAGEGRLAAIAAQDLAMHASIRSPAEAETWLRTAQDLRRADDVVGTARLTIADSLIALMRLDYAAAAERGAAAATAARNAGQQQLVMNAELFALEGQVLAGDLEAAELRLEALLTQAAGRPTDHLRVDTLTCGALLRARQGRGSQAATLLESLEPAAVALGPHYIAQWHAFSARVAQERGDFGSAVRHADEAARLETELDMPAWALRERLVSLVSRLAVGSYVALAELSQARSEARVAGAEPVAGLLGRWGELADLLVGAGNHALDVPEGPQTVETRALDLEIGALRDGRPDLLVHAADVWAELGTTVWRARALLWHSELTGAPSAEAEQMLVALQAPVGLAETLRSQVRDLSS